jgi:hypothetical protein
MLYEGEMISWNSTNAYRFLVAETYVENQSVQHGNETKNNPTT